MWLWKGLKLNCSIGIPSHGALGHADKLIVDCIILKKVFLSLFKNLNCAANHIDGPGFAHLFNDINFVLLKYIGQ